MRRGIVRSVIWWMYYGLFLGLCIFIFVAVIKYGIHLIFMGGRELTGAQILYGAAVGVMIFGLLSMSIAYLAQNIWYRIKGQPDLQRTGHHRPSQGAESTSTASEGAKAEKSEMGNHS